MIYSVVLNSNLKSSGTVANANYYFDWSVLPNTKYKVSGCFTSSAVNETSILDIAMLEVQLGQSKVFKSNATQTRASSTNCIGFLLANSTTTSSFLYGDITTIPPTFLYNRPNTNDFNVKILTNDAIPIEWTDAVGLAITEYILILTFETIDDK